MQYLLEATDQNHFVSAKNIAEHLKAFYEIDAEVRSVYRDIKEINKAMLMVEEKIDIYEATERLEDDIYDEEKFIVYDKSKNRNNISPNYLTKTFHSVISKSNLPQIRLHDLRHSVASNLLNNGFSVVQVQEWLGHGSASTTLNFYAHVDKTSKIGISDSLEKIIRI